MKNTLLLPELREYLATNKAAAIRSFCEEGHPAMVADLISSLKPDEVWRVLLHTSEERRAEIFAHLPTDIQVEVSSRLNRGELARLLTEMSPDDRVDLFKQFPEEHQEMILPALAQAEREDLRRLASFPEGTAGSVMTSDYATLLPDLTVAEAITRLRQEAPDKETIYYAYVIDENRKLLGLVSLKDLIIARSQALVKDIMEQDIVYVNADDDQEEAARKIEQYDLIALPVVNRDGMLIGIITHDDAFDIIVQEQTEDIEKLMAIGGAHEPRVYLSTSAWE
ncbi:MAG: magnesium transporter, partial [Candidatus Zixiibacteriota bacterium]